MNKTPSPYWPANLPSHMTIPNTNVFYNAEVSATRFPNKAFILFYDTPVTFAEFRQEAEWVAGFLQQECGVVSGDRVLLYLQNCPQWMIGFYGILRANAIAVPANPMSRTGELRHLISNSGAKTVIVAQDLYAQLEPLLSDMQERDRPHVIVVTYSDYVRSATMPAVDIPAFISASRYIDAAEVHHWSDALGRRLMPGPLTAGPDDLCVFPYTSGTTGQPKGCMHTHRNVMSTLVASAHWLARNQDAVQLSVLPLFHVTGMQGDMNGALYTGATVVVLPRWNRDAAAAAVEQYRITDWQAISTMVVDFVSNPEVAAYDLSSLKRISGGGAPMPEAVSQKLKALTGLSFIEGYGMSETMAATHKNPLDRPKAQCLGIAGFDVDARVIDPVTRKELGVDESGELVVNGPQVMQGYWRNPEETAKAFVELDGKRFLRTGDLVRVDSEGYYFMTDRLKRMINASGFKVWPAEVESLMYGHPAVQEICVIGTLDERRGETVKALIVLASSFRELTQPDDIIDWARLHMAVYKAPHVVEFVTSLPKSGSGKILWRELQDQETSRAAEDRKRAYAQ